MLIELNSELETRGVNVVRTVDISMLHAKENRGYPSAILIGIALSPSYLFRLSEENSMDVSDTKRMLSQKAISSMDFIMQRRRLRLCRIRKLRC